jgi:hypothetical protein
LIAKKEAWKPLLIFPPSNVSEEGLFVQALPALGSGGFDEFHFVVVLDDVGFFGVISVDDKVQKISARQNLSCDPSLP